jgi:hypothetical protein
LIVNRLIFPNVKWLKSKNAGLGSKKLNKRNVKSLSFQHKLTPQTLNRYARNAFTVFRWIIPILDAIAEKSLCKESGGDKRIQMTEEQQIQAKRSVVTRQMQYHLLHVSSCYSSCKVSFDFELWYKTK